MVRSVHPHAARTAALARWHAGCSAWGGSWAEGDVVGLALGGDGRMAVSVNGDWGPPHGVVFDDVQWECPGDISIMDNVDSSIR